MVRALHLSLSKVMMGGLRTTIIRALDFDKIKKKIMACCMNESKREYDMYVPAFSYLYFHLLRKDEKLHKSKQTLTG